MNVLFVRKLVSSLIQEDYILTGSDTCLNWCADKHLEVFVFAMKCNIISAWDNSLPIYVADLHVLSFIGVLLKRYASVLLGILQINQLPCSLFK
jgi:hypothetical protein